jgi:hypothetical protein
MLQGHEHHVSLCAFMFNAKHNDVMHKGMQLDLDKFERGVNTYDNV